MTQTAEAPAVEQGNVEGGQVATPEIQKAQQAADVEQPVQQAPSAGFGATQPSIDRGWLEGVPEEYREGVAKFATPGELAKGYVNVQKMASNKGLLPLGENATDEQRADFRSQLNVLNGVPETVEGYGGVKFGEGDQAKSISEIENGADFMNLAHNLNLNSEQLHGMVSGVVEMGESIRAAREQQMQQQSANNDELLHKHYGTNYDSVMERINNFAGKHMSAELYDHLESNMGLNNPLVIEFLDTVSALTSEDARPEGGSPITAEGEMEAAQKELREIMKLPLNDPNRAKRLDKNAERMNKILTK